MEWAIIVNPKQATELFLAASERIMEDINEVGSAWLDDISGTKIVCIDAPLIYWEGKVERGFDGDVYYYTNSMRPATSADLIKAGLIKE